MAVIIAAPALFGGAAQAAMNAPATVRFVPFSDPWPKAQERWMDISNHAERRFDGFISGSQPFNYASDYALAPLSGQPVHQTYVDLTYDQAPSTPYFVGHIEARGLKPNFAYQLKLAGKAQKGTRGWGAHGDDLANERLGYVGRWWCDSSHATQTNFDDSHYLNYYKNAPVGQEHNMYGYLFAGDFITDSSGNASVDFNGKSSYHITWADWQGGAEVHAGEWAIEGYPINSEGVHYGYGQTPPSTTVNLYYEYEGNNRPRDNVILLNGTYNARFLLTEESFHSTEAYGGFWQTVLAANDVTFSISITRPIAPDTLQAIATSSTAIALSWRDASNNEQGFKIERKDGKFWSQIATVGAGVTAYANSGLTAGKTYYYRVRAYNQAGDSAYSDIASAATPRPSGGGKK